MRRPIGTLGIDSSLSLELVFDQERDYVGEMHGGFLGIREAGDFLSGDQRRSGWRLYMTESARRVAYKCDVLTRCEKRLNQCDRVLVFREIPHRTVTARVENRIELCL